MTIYTGDPDRDAAVHLAQQDAEEQRWPHCDDCGEVVTDYIYIIHGEFLCEDCVNKTYRHEAVQYIWD